MTENDSTPAMTDAYHRARRQLALFSAILLFWEFVGIKVQALSVPATDATVTVKYGQAIPTVILFIVLYFALRLGIEWNQCPAERRVKPSSRIDLALSYAVSGFALVIFGVQQAPGARFADWVTPMTVVSNLWGFSAAVLTIRFLPNFPETRGPIRWSRFGWDKANASGLLAFSISTVMIFILLGFTNPTPHRWAQAAGAAEGAFVIVWWWAFQMSRVAARRVA